MRAWLFLQEGPGAGHSYPLDPVTRKVYSIGRSSECAICLNDTRASRHHADIRWDGQRWTVIDQSSTNGTYVNGMRVHGPYDLRLGDRVTIGETTMVLRQASGGSTGARPVAAAPGLRRPGLSQGQSQQGNQHLPIEGGSV